MTNKLTPNFELGYSNQTTIKLDFDRIPLRLVKYWARRACLFFMLEGFIIFQSSYSSYHVVFNLPVTWEMNIEVICWVAIESQLEKLRDYVLLQGRKKTSTLRLGNKGEKPPPKILFRYGKQDKEIKDFLEERREIKQVYRTLILDLKRAHEHVPKN
jgi:hypothetical protein